MGLNTTPRTWVAGEKPPASTWNTEIRDALTGIQAAWTTYTPTLTGITLGNGTVAAQYRQIGKTVQVQMLFTAGSTTTYSGNFAISLPVTAAAVYGANSALGAAIVNPTGARTLATAVYSTTTTFVLISASGLVSATSPGTWTTTSGLGVTFEYQAA